MSQRRKTIVLAGVPFGIGMGLYFNWHFGFSFGLLGGLFCGIFFGILTNIFTEIQTKKMQSQTGVFEDEAIIFQGGANHFKGRESRGGWLTLTSTRLAFRSHGINFQNTPLDIPLTEIESADPALTFRFIPNGLRIKRKNGVVESFVVYHRKTWTKLITEKL